MFWLYQQKDSLNICFISFLFRYALTIFRCTTICKHICRSTNANQIENCLNFWTKAKTIPHNNIEAICSIVNMLNGNHTDKCKLFAVESQLVCRVLHQLYTLEIVTATGTDIKIVAKCNWLKLKYDITCFALNALNSHRNIHMCDCACAHLRTVAVQCVVCKI